MSNTDLDGLGIVKKFPDLEGGITLVQGGPGWDKPEYRQYGYSTPKLKNIKVWRKTFSFNKKLKPDQEITIYISLPKLTPDYGKFDGIEHCHNGSGHSIKLRGSNHPSVNKNTPDDVLKK